MQTTNVVTKINTEDTSSRLLSEGTISKENPLSVFGRVIDSLESKDLSPDQKFKSISQLVVHIFKEGQKTYETLRHVSEESERTVQSLNEKCAELKTEFKDLESTEKSLIESGKEFTTHTDALDSKIKELQLFKQKVIEGTINTGLVTSIGLLVGGLCLPPSIAASAMFTAGVAGNYSFNNWYDRHYMEKWKKDLQCQFLKDNPKATVEELNSYIKQKYIEKIDKQIRRILIISQI